MTRKKKNGTTKFEGTSSDARRTPRPSDVLKQLYKKNRDLSANETFLRLAGVVDCLKKGGGEIHPKDSETVWLILANICERAFFEDLKRVANFIESKNLYSRFGLCCRHALETCEENSRKKRKLECLLEACCKTSTSYLAVAENAGTTIQPNFFLDLYNFALKASAEIGKINSKILTSLETLQRNPSGNEPREDSGIHEEMMENDTSLLDTQPPNDIASMNVVPTHEDIFWSGATFLRPNILRQPYPDLETYKDVQFRLLHEDFMQPLRRGVSKLLNGQVGPKGIPEVRIYEDIRLKIARNSRLVPERETSWRLYSVKFKPLVKVNWSTSRRLIHGSLVCLWNGVNSFLVASVVNR